jgi:hypothetical protein
MRAVTAPGRWVWRISGLITVVALAGSSFHLITSLGSENEQPPQHMVARTVTVSQSVTSLSVQSYGAPVQVTGGRVSHPQVTEAFAIEPGSGTPSVAATVRGGHLAVGSSACSSWENCVSFSVTVPEDTTVAVGSDGGPVTVSGVAAVNLDSGGGSMRVSGIDGPVTVTSEGGPVQLAAVTGPTQVDTGGGSLLAWGITTATGTFTTDGGPVQLGGRIGTLQAYTGGGSASIALSTAPDAVTIDSDGGPATLTVPGGPYALTVATDGGPEAVNIATDPGAPRSITMNSGGGPLQINP